MAVRARRRGRGVLGERGPVGAHPTLEKGRAASGLPARMAGETNKTREPRACGLSAGGRGGAANGVVEGRGSPAPRAASVAAVSRRSIVLGL